MSLQDQANYIESLIQVSRSVLEPDHPLFSSLRYQWYQAQLRADELHDMREEEDADAA